MPLFTYKALHEDKTAYTGSLEAENRFAVYAHIKKEGGEVVHVEEEKKHLKVGSGDIFAPLKRVSEVDKILLTRNLGAMLTAGLPLSRALGVIERQSKKAKLQEVVRGIVHEIEQGGSLSSGMLKYPSIFSSLITAMVEAGEESGTLSETLATIANQLENAHELKKKIKGAMMYPAIILSALLIVGALMMIYIVPTLTAAFKDLGANLPATTKFVMTLSDFLVAHTILAALSLIGIIALFIGIKRTKVGGRFFETVFLRTPLIGGLIQETNSARTTRTLSSLLSSGVNMLTAITITKNVLQNTHYKEVLIHAEEQVQKGQPLAQVFIEAGVLFPPLVGELIAVGEETGALPDMLLQVAVYYEREVSQKTKNMSTIIEPFLMLIVGVGVGFFAVAMIAPIYNITGSIQ